MAKRVRRVKVWTCQRQKAGVKCGYKNPKVKRKCVKCGGKKPVTKKPAHRAILDELPYEAWVEKYGERCGICGRKPTARRRLDRDHDHKTGKSRGLLCARCNRALPGHITIEWMQNAIKYLERANGQ